MKAPFLAVAIAAAVVLAPRAQADPFTEFSDEIRTEIQGRRDALAPSTDPADQKAVKALDGMLARLDADAANLAADLRNAAAIVKGLEKLFADEIAGGGAFDLLIDDLLDAFLAQVQSGVDECAAAAAALGDPKVQAGVDKLLDKAAVAIEGAPLKPTRAAALKGLGKALGSVTRCDRKIDKAVDAAFIRGNLDGTPFTWKSNRFARFIRSFGDEGTLELGAQDLVTGGGSYLTFSAYIPGGPGTYDGGGAFLHVGSTDVPEGCLVGQPHPQCFFGQGEVVITEIDLVARTVRGTFSFSFTGESGERTITGGSFSIRSLDIWNPE